jgi:hypothetical protein
VVFLLRSQFGFGIGVMLAGPNETALSVMENTGRRGRYKIKFDSGQVHL